MASLNPRKQVFKVSICPERYLIFLHRRTLTICFHLSIHLSQAQKCVNSRFRAFSLIKFPLIGMFLNQVKTVSSRSLLSLFFSFFWLGFTWPDSFSFSFFHFLQCFMFFCDWNVYSFHLNKIHNCSRLRCTSESLNLMRSNIAKIQILMFHLNGSDEITWIPWM